MTERHAIYPGSFDPLHLGHVNIIERALGCFDKVTIALLNNTAKSPIFTVEERRQLIEQALPNHPGLSTATFDGLLVDFARSIGATFVVRGLRTSSDFEYEFQMAMMNRRLAPDLETVFMMTDERHFFLSSRLIREVHALGGDVRSMVPDAVLEGLDRKSRPGD